MAISWPISILLVSFTLTIVNCEQFTALVDLEHLIYREREMKSSLREYITLEENRLNVLKKFLQKVEDVHSSIVDNNLEGFLGHPVNSYVLIKRFNSEWPYMEQTVQHDNSEGKLLSSISYKFPLFMNEILIFD